MDDKKHHDQDQKHRDQQPGQQDQKRQQQHQHGQQGGQGAQIDPKQKHDDEHKDGARKQDQQKR